MHSTRANYYVSPKNVYGLIDFLLYALNPVYTPASITSSEQNLKWYTSMLLESLSIIQYILVLLDVIIFTQQ